MTLTKTQSAGSPDSMPVLAQCWLRYGKSGQPTVGYQRCATAAPVFAPLYTGVISTVWAVDYTENYKYFLAARNTMHRIIHGVNRIADKLTV